MLAACEVVDNEVGTVVLQKQLGKVEEGKARQEPVIAGRSKLAEGELNSAWFEFMCTCVCVCCGVCRVE